MDIKTCPACGTPSVPVHISDVKWWVRCLSDSCHATGPIRRIESEAVSAWNAMPRRDDVPAPVAAPVEADYVNQVEVDGVVYSIEFARSWDVTTCAVAYGGTGTLDSAYRNPNEDENQDIGRRYALKYASMRTPAGRKLYDAWRKAEFAKRKPDGWKPKPETKFKIGDKVRIVKDPPQTTGLVGRIATIKHIDTSPDPLLYRISIDDGLFWCYSSDLGTGGGSKIMTLDIKASGRDKRDNAGVSVIGACNLRRKVLK